jgi:hypothetical protein
MDTGRVALWTDRAADAMPKQAPIERRGPLGPEYFAPPNHKEALWLEGGV